MSKMAQMRHSSIRIKGSATNYATLTSWHVTTIRFTTVVHVWIYLYLKSHIRLHLFMGSIHNPQVLWWWPDFNLGRRVKEFDRIHALTIRCNAWPRTCNPPTPTSAHFTSSQAAGLGTLYGHARV